MTGRTRRVLRWLAGLVVLVAVFAAGLALGEALHDSPKPGVTTTSERTLVPVPLAPVTETVTVTATKN